MEESESSTESGTGATFLTPEDLIDQLRSRGPLTCQQCGQPTSNGRCVWCRAEGDSRYPEPPCSTCRGIGTVLYESFPLGTVRVPCPDCGDTR